MLGLGSEVVSEPSATIVFGENTEHLAINEARIISADKASE